MKHQPAATLAMITMHLSAFKFPARGELSFQWGRDPRKDSSGIVSGLDAVFRGWMQFSRGGGAVRPAVRSPYNRPHSDTNAYVQAPDMYMTLYTQLGGWIDI